MEGTIQVVIKNKYRFSAEKYIFSAQKKKKHPIGTRKIDRFPKKTYLMQVWIIPK